MKIGTGIIVIIIILLLGYYAIKFAKDDNKFAPFIESVNPLSDDR